MNETIAHVGRRVLAGEHVNRSDFLSLIALARQGPHDLLYWAWRVRKNRFGRAVRLCSIAAGKLGACSEDCKWCAQSADSAPGITAPQRATSGEMQAAAAEASKLGAASFGIVNSGRTPTAQDLDEIVQAAEAIRTGGDHGVEICASLGELSDESAAKLAAAGVKRYNHNLETSRRFYGQVVTTHSYDDRLATLAAARRAGMSLCCGGIFGLGETWQDRVDLALSLRDRVQPDVVPLNFLHPIPGTPLAGAEPLKPMEILTIIAFFRLILPEADLKVAGGREVNLHSLQSWIFYAGATSILIGNYLTTVGQSPQDDLQMIADLGLTVVRELPCGAGESCDAAGPSRQIRDLSQR